MVAVGELLAPVPRVAPVVDAAVVASWVERLSATADARLEPEGLVDLLRSLEELKCTAEAVQTVAAAELDVATRAEEQRRGLPAAHQGRGVAAQVALARRESPSRGRQHLGLALVLRREMPCTLAALHAGRITEWRATLLARETACLSREDRAEVDRAMAGDQVRLEAMGEGELVAEARARSYRLDPEAAVRRRRRAEADRRVSLRPAPDTMSKLSALLPVRDGVAVFASLCRQADAVVAAGDGRGRGQIMADTLVERLLGVTGSADASVADAQAATGLGAPGDSGAAPGDGQTAPGGSVGAGSEAVAPQGANAPAPHPAVAEPSTEASGAGVAAAETTVMIHLLVSDAVLFGAAGAGHVDGYGPVPGDLARQLATTDGAWIRRLYAAPETGELVAADSRARRFPARLAQLIRLRDRTCRTPWCDAPVRHTDHVVAAADGGPTSLDNGQGLCEACNYAKQSPGWTARPRPGPRHTVRTTTPTGHVYRSTAPPPLDPATPRAVAAGACAVLEPGTVDATRGAQDGWADHTLTA